MPKPTPEKVITQKHRRLFIQWGGPRPNNRRYYGGVDGQEMAVGDDSNPISGGINPIRIHDPNVIGRYKNVGRTIDPPDLPTVPVMFYIDHGGIPRSQINRNCPFNVYEVVGKCATLSDFNGGWESFVKVYSYLEATDDSGSGNFNFDSDEASMIEWDTTAEAIYYIGAIGMGQKASTQVDRNVVDIVYGTRIQCGDCGPTLDGTDWIYAITDSSGTGSPGLPAELIYTVDGGGTWTEVSIDGLGADDSPSAIDIIGNYLVVLSNAACSCLKSTTLRACQEPLPPLPQAL